MNRLNWKKGFSENPESIISAPQPDPKPPLVKPSRNPEARVFQIVRGNIANVGKAHLAIMTTALLGMLQFLLLEQTESLQIHVIGFFTLVATLLTCGSLLGSLLFDLKTIKPRKHGISTTILMWFSVLVFLAFSFLYHPDLRWSFFNNADPGSATLFWLPPLRWFCLVVIGAAMTLVIRYFLRRQKSRHRTQPKLPREFYEGVWKILERLAGLDRSGGEQHQT